MRKRPPLSERKRKWAEARGDVTLNGTKLSYNVSQQMRYVRALRALVRKMTDETNREVRKLFEGKVSEKYFEKQKEVAALDESLSNKAKKLMSSLMLKFDGLFGRTAKILAETMVDGAKKASASSLHSSLEQLSGGLSLKTSVVPAGMEEVAQASVYENVQLIKSIPTEYLDDVFGSVMRSITTGNGLADLIPALRKYDGITDRRAKNIALDQTRKAYNSINKQRLMAVGIKKFRWSHSAGGQTPRQDHIDMNGKIFSFDDLPIIDRKTGERGIPGQAINCRCTMTPVYEFDSEGA